MIPKGICAGEITGMKAVVAVAKTTVAAVLAATVAVAASAVAVPAQITATVPVPVNTAAPAVKTTESTSAAPQAALPAAQETDDAVTGTIRFEAMQRDAAPSPAAETGETPKAETDDTATDSEEAGEAPAPAFDLTDGVWLEYYVDGLCFNAYRFDADGTYTMEFYQFSRDLNDAPKHTPEYDRTGAYTVDDDGVVYVDDEAWTYLEETDRFSHYRTFYYFNAPDGSDALLKEDFLFHHPDIPATSAQAAQEGVENRDHI